MKGNTVLNTISIQALSIPKTLAIGDAVDSTYSFLNASSNPSQFAGTVTLSTLTATRLVASNGSKVLISNPALTANGMVYPTSAGALESTVAATNAQFLQGVTGTTPFLGSISGSTNINAGWNNTTGFSLDTTQDIWTGASPSFVNVTLSSRTATRVAFFGTGGVFDDSAAFTYATGTGRLSLTTTGSGAGIMIGGDALLYRSAADVFTTPDSLVIGTNLTVSSLTTTRVPFASTAGLLIDSANFAYTTGTGQLALATTGSGAGILLGGDAQIYRGAADVVQIPDQLTVSAPVVGGTATSGYGALVTRTFTPSGSSSGRVWGLNFTVYGTGSQNMTDAAGGLTGVEGAVQYQGTGTVTSMAMQILSPTITAAGTITLGAGLDLYGPDVSTTGTATTWYNQRIRGPRGSGGGTVGTYIGSRYEARSWSTGHLTSYTGIDMHVGSGFYAFSANAQTRIGIDIGAMPDPGAFTTPVVHAIRMSTSARVARNGIQWGTDTGGANLYSSASNTVKTDGILIAGKAFTSGVVTLTDGATPALDASLGNTFVLTAAGNRTIAVPTNATSGQMITIVHIASGADRTLALNTGAGGFAFGTDITALTATTSGLTDYIGCKYSAASAKWHVVSYLKGFA